MTHFFLCGEHTAAAVAWCRQHERGQRSRDVTFITTEADAYRMYGRRGPDNHLVLLYTRRPGWRLDIIQLAERQDFTIESWDW